MHKCRVLIKKACSHYKRFYLDIQKTKLTEGKFTEGKYTEQKIQKGKNYRRKKYRMLKNTEN